MQQACITKFFKPLDPVNFGEYHEWLFEKEEADRIRREEELKARIRAERDRLRAIQREKKKARDLKIEQRCAERIQRRAELARKKLEGQMVIPGLYVGGRLAAQNWEWLQEMYKNNGLAFILNVTPNISNFYLMEECDVGGEGGGDENTGIEEQEMMEIERFIAELATSGEEVVGEGGEELQGVGFEPSRLEERGSEADFSGVCRVLERVGDVGDDLNERGDILEQISGMDDEEKLKILERVVGEQDGGEEDEEQLVEEELVEGVRRRKKIALGLLEKYRKALANGKTKEGCLMLERLNFRYKRISICDDREEDLRPHLEEAIGFIRDAMDAGKSVLVHCREGRSRSVAIVMAYLIVVKKWTFDESLEHVSRVVPDQNVNEGFLEQLMELERGVRLECSEDCKYPESGPRRSRRVRKSRVYPDLGHEDCLNRDGIKTSKTKKTCRNGIGGGLSAVENGGADAYCGTVVTDVCRDADVEDKEKSTVEASEVGPKGEAMADGDPFAICTGDADGTSHLPVMISEDCGGETGASIGDGNCGGEVGAVVGDGESGFGPVSPHLERSKCAATFRDDDSHGRNGYEKPKKNTVDGPRSYHPRGARRGIGCGSGRDIDVVGMKKMTHYFSKLDVG